MLLSVPKWLIDGLICWGFSQSLGTVLSLFAAVLIVGVGALGASIPSAPGYVGTYELAASIVTIVLGTSPEAAVSLALLLHVTTLLPVAITGAGSLLALGKGNLFALARVAADRES